MFMIHNTLVEDSKVFEAEEEPTASKLYDKIQQNPESLEQESFQTSIRRMYSEIDEETKQRIAILPSRVKVAKKHNQYSLTGFIKKGMGLFIRGVSGDKQEPAELLFEEALPLIKCGKNEKALPLSDRFWDRYTQIKDLKEKVGVPSSVLSVEKKAFFNTKALLTDRNDTYREFHQLLTNLVEDIDDYKTLSDYAKDEKKIATNKTELANLQNDLGLDYLSKIKQKIGQLDKEVIVAIENIGD